MHTLCLGDVYELVAIRSWCVYRVVVVEDTQRDQGAKVYKESECQVGLQGLKHSTSERPVFVRREPRIIQGVAAAGYVW